MRISGLLENLGAQSDASSGDARREKEKQDILGRLRSGNAQERGLALWQFQNMIQVPAREALPVLVGLLQPVTSSAEPEAAFQHQVIQTLAGYGKEAQPVLPDLIRYAQTPRLERGLLAEAFIAGRTIDPKSRDLLSLGIAVVSDEALTDAIVLDAALEVIAIHGTAAAEAIPHLVRILQNGATHTQYLAFTALGNLLPRKSISPGIDISQMSPLEGAATFRAILESSGRATYLAPQLLTILTDRPEMYLKVAVIDSYKKLGPGNYPDALKTILPLVASYDTDVANHALAMVLAIRKSEREAIPILIDGLASGDERVRSASVRALLVFGKEARNAVPAVAELIKQAGSENAFTPDIPNYTRFLYELGSVARAAVPAILLQFSTGSSLRKAPALFRTSASYLMTALASIGVPKDALPYIREGLDSNSMVWAAASARAAGNLGADGVVVLPQMVRVLENPRMDTFLTQFLEANCAFPGFNHTDMTSVHLEVIYALGKMREAARPAIPALTKIATLDARGDRYTEEKALAAREAILKIAPKEGARLAVDRMSVDLKVGAKVGLNRAVPDLPLNRIDGKRLRLSAFQGKPTILVFVDTACPCVEAYVERLRTLDRKWSKSGVQMILVFAHPKESMETIRRFAERNRLPGTVIRDAEQRVTSVFNAKVTTESFVLDAKGVLRYHGRIDDNIYNPGSVRTRDLENAVRAVADGQKVRVAETAAVGCDLPRATPTTSLVASAK